MKKNILHPKKRSLSMFRLVTTINFSISPTFFLGPLDWNFLMEFKKHLRLIFTLDVCIILRKTVMILGKGELQNKTACPKYDALKDLEKCLSNKTIAIKHGMLKNTLST